MRLGSWINGLYLHLFLEDARLPAEMQIEFWKPNIMLDNSDKIVALSPLEPLSNLARDQEGKLGMGGISRVVISSLSESSWHSVDYHPKSWFDLYMLTAANNMNGNRTNTNLIHTKAVCSLAHCRKYLVGSVRYPLYAF
ncbi:hypothetical protein SLEP1_g44464 [Rubroshorea leprosula]|uniref:Uncharacterized protein n=1 Tax=Rubroshorea leprosula TaxID=152421 RepID=A0AAV5LG90_9ROSI|nr:hypothetical protein SLEP1_g44464 [Rubroshorea leprosula]